MRRRHLLRTLGASALAGSAGCTGQSNDATPAFVASSPAFSSGDELPARFTCDGAGVSPPFVIERVPKPTAALAVTAEYDGGVFSQPVFWTLWNVPPETERIPAGLPREPTLDTLGGARQGTQPPNEPGYEPPCPPAGQPYEHRFQVFALGEELALDGGADQEPATEAIANALIASTRITVDYTHPVPTDG
ncbi:YbhB/YbcL family Raf kinase inhibitor-like protein [Haloarcula brevis]|uniref:YbhB/YbcL family Raf kinase inhibitor-like protein n=1 Tax=Haloarcula brevis TaxID=3111453 RepID=UPI00300F413F